MELSLILKGIGTAIALGSFSTGTWAIVDRNCWTSLDEEAFSAKDGSWTWEKSPTSEKDLTPGEKHTASITLKKINGSNGITKTWICSIVGIAPDGVEAGAKIKIHEQLDALAQNIGLTTSNGTNTFTKPTDQTKLDKLEKFFSKCIGARTFSQGKKAKWGTKAEGTMEMEIKKIDETPSNNHYKFDQEKMNGLLT